MTLSVTEAADHSSVTLVDTSNAAGGFVANSPCYNTASDTAVCPTTVNGLNVFAVQVNLPVGDNHVTIDVARKVVVTTGHGNNWISVPNSTSSNISLGNGNDTVYGGTGADTVALGGGTDVVHLYSSPAAADSVTCGNANVESPSDTVYIDTSDTLVNNNCLHVYYSP